MAKAVVPKTLGACVDRLYALRTEIAKAKEREEALRKEQSAIKEHLIQTLPKSDARGIAGKRARATITTKPKATVKDWGDLYKHILRTGEFELLQRRVSDAAVKERWDVGVEVAGVEPYTVVDVSVTKI